MIGKPFFVLQHLQTDWIESVSNHLFQRGETCGGAVRLAKGSENGLLSYYRKCSEKHEPLALSWGETSDKVRSNTVQSRSFLSHNPPGNQEANQDAAIVTTCCAWEINYSPLLVCSLCFLLNESVWALQDRCSLTKIFFFFLPRLLAQICNSHRKALARKEASIGTTWHWESCHHQPSVIIV